MFDPEQFQLLQSKLGTTFTVDACCNDSGDNRLVPKYYSPSNSFLQQQLSGTEVVWLNPPFNSLREFIAHYKKCKAAHRKLSACIVAPRWPGAHTPLLTGMIKVASYAKGTKLFYAPGKQQDRNKLLPGTPWPVEVWYDPPEPPRLLAATASPNLTMLRDHRAIHR